MIDPSTSGHYVQSLQYEQYMEKLGWQIVSLDQEYVGYKRKIIGPFSILKFPRVPLNKIDFQQLDTLSSQHHALFVKLEPADFLSPEGNINEYLLLENYGFQSDSFPILQTKTILVDLQQSEDQLLKELRSETRHHLRKSWQQKFQLTIQPNDGSEKAHQNFESFYQLFEACARERKFYSPFHEQMQALWKSFGEQATILLVKQSEGETSMSRLQKNILSGALILIHNNTAYYKFGASIPFGRAQHSSYFLFWEMFKWAREKGLRLFDLEGIYDSRYHRTKKYHGFTQFKRGWSKKEITYLGSFTKYYGIMKFLNYLPTIF